MEPLEQNIGPKKGNKGQPIFQCKVCDYSCCKIYSRDRHLSTSKHINRTKSNVLEQNEGTHHTKCFNCKYCNKCYNVRNSLWYHEKICINLHIIGGVTSLLPQEPTPQEPTPQEPTPQEPITEEPTDKALMMMILKQNYELIKEQSNLSKDNTELKQLMLEIVKNGTNNNNTINSHNKAFNLNFFLNDTCKNAMNINEFLDSIQLELDDLMELGELGYVASMSKIITKNLNALDETIRPIHCTDTKREIFYIKDADKWEKEDVEMKKLRKLILKLSLKTYKLIPQYREKFPDYNSSTSTHSDEHCIIIMEAMTCDKLKDEKIIRNISRVTTIAK
jgi:hypothetical protein